jgi:glycosyltransferase involved in cell wall biosynthesis
VVNSPGFVEPVGARAGRAPHVIPNGVDPAMFSPGEHGDAFRGAHNLGESFVVLYAGAHGLSNDLDVLLDAAQRLRERPDIRFVLVGDGKEKPRLMARADERGLANVHFLPSIPKSEMGPALAAADVCVAILKPIQAYKTTYPNKVFDYMAAGRPVILAIDGVIRSLVDGAGAGVFVPPGDPGALADAVLRLRDQPDARQAMGKRGRRVVEKSFNRADLADEMEAALKGHPLGNAKLREQAP